MLAKTYLEDIIASTNFQLIVSYVIPKKLKLS